MNFQGCEGEALSLFMKIDKRRLEIREEAALKIVSTPKKKKGSMEVQNKAGGKSTFNCYQ